MLYEVRLQYPTGLVVFPACYVRPQEIAVFAQPPDSLATGH
jgi:hypothetical protein